MAPDPPADGTLWYFGYGSNMCPDIFEGRRGIRPLARAAARLDGYRLCFDIPVGPGERGVANLEPAAGERLWGVAYLVTEKDAGHLDRTEGVAAGFYRRIAVELALDGGPRVAAFAYRSSLSAAGRKPSPRYIGLLLAGARVHGLPAEWLLFLESLELAHDERSPDGH